MIHVESLVKRYGGLTALDRVSFDVARGEILGFLGPNGAGKTTTMRILTCFLPATAGVAQVAGFDVFAQPVEVRQRVGYLPESVPLYPEMRVSEYLDFRARLKHVVRAARSGRIKELVETCGLGEVVRRPIAQLSRGYRQRVGLADALIASPPILILDEPTVGLDPNQIREVRTLIRELGKEHTILLSTHILPEVEMVCGRVVIIHQGRVVAQDTPARLREQLEGRSRVVVEVRGGPEEQVRETLGRIAGVKAVSPDGARLVIDVEPGKDVREDVFRAVVAGGWTLTELRTDAMSLEDIFVRVTTREDEGEKPVPKEEAA
ncbi:MAG TPA: ATP-binding cassette domain-containing protein [Polyangia bacterium]|nr:ATP-binding cassette domain-containing protein [Polyangia bacterium]